MRAPDAAFADPRLAALYDLLDDDRSDLDAYEAIVRELGAERVADVGCGTGSFAVRLAGRGLTVVGVDPAAASLEVARGKPYADGVTWIHGDATDLADVPPLDLAVMTGNVAQVFVDDEDWAGTLDGLAAAVRPGGWLVLETRRPEARAWEHWDQPASEVTLPDGRTATASMSVTEVALPLVTFVGTISVDGEDLRSTSTLRFRSRAEVGRDLAAHGFDVVEVREAPDRLGLEHVFIARRHTS
ncbi:SAM-dependent methyltransferase [Nocardioides cavernae]|uniref:SAM-dependent methyltransferase n=1 Tax=Nocardioides cavernae TaxID=1921566 RepID=A0A7Y9H3U8_9ACTN|nr:class I SAM-dependent methyltransferase [Nocardioides cavernae]NYE37472.1 SAM-dependent methyltransferase [Nocardioides cavernae]